GFSPELEQIFSGVTACPSQISSEDRSTLWALITFYGGNCQLGLNKKCTHLIIPEPKGEKYEYAFKRESIKIVTPDWVADSIVAKSKRDEVTYHPRLVVYEEEEEEEEEEMIDNEEEEQESQNEGSGDEKRSIKSSPATSREGSPLNTQDYSPKANKKTDELKGEIMFDDSSDSSPEKQERNLNWTPAEVPQPAAAKRRLSHGKDSGLINLCANVPPVPGNILPPEIRGTTVGSGQGTQGPERPETAGWSPAAVRTLRNITNNADIQQINRPSNVAHILQSLSAPTKNLEQGNQTQQGHPNTLLFSQVKQLTSETQHLLQQSHQAQQHHPLLHLQPQQIMQLQPQQQQQQQHHPIPFSQQQTHPFPQQQQHQQQQIHQPHQFSQQQQLQFQQQLHRPQQQLQQLHQLQQQQRLQQLQQQNLQQQLHQQPQHMQQLQIKHQLQQHLHQIHHAQQQHNVQQQMQTKMPQQVQHQIPQQQQQHHILIQQQQQQQPVQQHQLFGHDPAIEGEKIEFISNSTVISFDSVVRESYEKVLLNTDHTDFSVSKEKCWNQVLHPTSMNRSPSLYVQNHSLSPMNQSPSLYVQNHSPSPVNRSLYVQNHSPSPMNRSPSLYVQNHSPSSYVYVEDWFIGEESSEVERSQGSSSKVINRDLGKKIAYEQTFKEENVSYQFVVQELRKMIQQNYLQNQIREIVLSMNRLPKHRNVLSNNMHMLQQQFQQQPLKPRLVLLLQKKTKKPPERILRLENHSPVFTVPNDCFLIGCIFSIADYPEQMSDKQLLATWKRIIQVHGGAVDPTLNNRCTHLLCESQVSNMYAQALREGKRCVTAHWLNTVLKKKKMVPPHRALHFPVAFPHGGKPCSQHIISVTGFVDGDREDLKLMAYVAGAKYTGYLCRSNTVLICKEPSGLKYEKAKEWRIPCVNAQWLCDILLGNFEALRQIQHSRYTTFNLKDPLAPNQHLVSNLLAAWRVPLKVSPGFLMGIRLPPKQKQNESSIQPPVKRARIEDLPPPTKKLPPESTPMVLLTGFEPTQVQQYIKKKLHFLGGEIADSAQKCTHLVASKVTRTVKFLTAISVVKHIITPEWLEESFKCQKFVDEQNFMLRDAEAEVLFSFSLEESLKRAHSAPLFKGKYFYITPGICPSLSTMKAIVECAGGKVLSRQPSFRKIMEHKQNKSLPEIILISCENDLHLCREYFARKLDVHNAEFILTGVLTQTLDYESYPFL
uniref:PAX-interacting protein 1 n=1 Tax=Latimeria chalumnae TaxID=7897 RepID=H3AA33_LATCH